MKQFTVSDIVNLSTNEIERALKTGTDPNVLLGGDSINRTPLMLSIIFEKPGVFKMLLKYGADVNKTDEYGQNVLHYSSRNNSHINYLCILLHFRSFGDVDCFDAINDTPLAKAILNKSYDQVCLLLDAGAKIRKTTTVIIPNYVISLVKKRNQLKRIIILFLALSKKTKAVHKDLLSTISKMVWKLRNTEEKEEESSQKRIC